MRNIDIIRQMSLEEVAPYLLRSKIFYDWGDEFEVYVSPSGLQYLSYEDAIEDCIKWLDLEYDETNLSCEMR